MQIRGGRATVILPDIVGAVSQDALHPSTHQNFAGKGGECRQYAQPGSLSRRAGFFFFRPGKEPAHSSCLEEEVSMRIAE